ncbi:MAG: heavy metal translocating P-type ATPase [Clostridiales bacterium]|nr:heavy metal translocating P-type ATPase [Clostridiales bacterium]
MAKYDVTGMSCAACQAHVEKAVNNVPGVESCAVSLLTNSMTVEGSASPESIIKAVESAGYGASQSGADKTDKHTSLDNKEIPVLRRRLIISAVFLAVLMYFSMGVHMWNWPAPSMLRHNIIAIGIIEMLIAGIVMTINQKFFISGTKAVIHGAPNMDTLVAMGSGVSFLYSVYALIKMSVPADTAVTEHLYFESAAMIVTLITIGKFLEAISKGRTTNALKSLMELAPQSAAVIRDNNEIIVPIEEVLVGDVFIVKPGDKIPVDGVVLEGISAVNESALTGESVPVDKSEGDKVSAATINTSGFLKCRAERVGEDTTLSQIIKMVSDSAATKAPIARLADKVSGIFVPAVLGIAAIVCIIWLLIGSGLTFALMRGITVLVVSCPCALGLATPVAIMAGNGLGAKNGILFKTSEALEQTGRTSIVALDKTGTITRGEPSVTDVLPASGINEDELIRIAASLESKSEHPLARAIVSHAEETDECTEFKAIPGKGLTGIVNGKKAYGGNKDYIIRLVNIPDDAVNESVRLSGEGKTPLFFSYDGKIIGIIAVADTIKEEASKAIEELHNMGIKTVMLTGDNERTAKAIASKAGVDQVIAGVLPDGKSKVINELRKYGKVTMVGDGINDAPALTGADIGIAIGAGTDVAIDAADVVLVNSKLTDVPAAIRLSRRTVTIIHENLFWAFIYNILLIPIAAGALGSLGIIMNPVLGAAAMSISSFTVCMNALRINLFDVSNPKHDRSIRNQAEIPQEITGGTDKMATTKTISIEGMMCTHCEKSVRNALMDIPGVIKAEVSHENGTAVVELDGDVTDEMLTKAVTDKDYTVKGIS